MVEVKIGYWTDGPNWILIWSGNRNEMQYCSRKQNHNASRVKRSMHFTSFDIIIYVKFHVILLTILTLGAGGRFDSHFWTQSGAPSPYLAFRAPPRFQAIYGVESVPRFQPIFGTQSAPPPAFKLYMVLKACPPRFQPIFGTQSAPPLSSSIWCWERAPLSTHI